MRRTKEDALKTRNTILDAAVELFAEKGVANTSLEQIGKKAKVTRGAIYWHFQNKSEIFDALHERLYQPLAQMIMQDLEQGHHNPLEQLENMCVQLLLDMERDPKKRHAMTVFTSQSNYSGNMSTFRDQHLAKKAESLKLFSKYFEKAKDEKKLSDVADSDLLAQSVCFFMKGIIVEHLNNPDGFDLETNAHKIINQFFKQFK